MKLLLDINVSRSVAKHLRDHGMDVVHVGDNLDPRSPDEEILKEAIRIGAVVVSRDQDFSALLAVNGATGPSLINLRISAIEAGEVARAIQRVVDLVAEDLTAGAVATVEDTKVRVRRLPMAPRDER